MLMNVKISFDRFYCINSVKTKEIMVHYILQSQHMFIRVKALILCAFPSDFSFTLCAAPGNERKLKTCTSTY